MRFSFLTLGCKVNRSETNTIESALTNSGHEIVSLSESPDICIVNTCTVTAKSDYQSRQYIRRAIRSGAEVYATGCYAHLNKDEILNGISDSVRIVDNRNKLNIIKDYCNINKCNTLDINISRSRAFVKIQDGCNYSCSYCTIPLARGKSKSFKPELIIDEINGIHSSGINEIVLTGVHIGLYGLDLSPEIDLKHLLSHIIKKTDIPRIRLSSLEIMEIDDQMLEIIEDKRVCKHLHIPLQSGDDTILKKMNRSYSSSDFKKKVGRIIDKYPYISMGSDVIVGFPGEGEAEFNNTRNFLINNEISYFHVFPYSKRKNTTAFSYPYQIDKKVKNERVQLLLSLSDEKKNEYMSSFVGSKLDVIVEDKISGNTFNSTSGNYLKVRLHSSSLKQGSLIAARITDVVDGRLAGIPINES